MLNVIKVCGIYCYIATENFVPIGAEGKIKINEARGDYFFYPNVTLWGHFFALALTQDWGPFLLQQVTYIEVSLFSPTGSHLHEK